MTLSEFNRDWVSLLQLIVTAVGLGSLVLLWWQIRKTSNWNRLTSQYNFLNNAISVELSKNLYKAARRLNINLKGRLEPLTNEEVKALISDDESYVNIFAYLNEFENICGAVRAGVADFDVAYGIHSARVIIEFNVYKPFIETIRERDEDDEIWIEFECIYRNWKAKADKEAQKKITARQCQRQKNGIRKKT